MSIIIGITGTMGAGKDTIADHLVDKWNFIHHSCSDALRDELVSRGEEEGRDILRKIGSKLRSKFGTGILGERIKQKITDGQEPRTVVTSLRHPDEIKALREGKNSKFSLVSVDADTRKRFERLRKRDRKGDSATLKQFKAQEAKEMGTTGAGQQIGVCMSMADYKISNDDDFEDLYKKIDKIIHGLGIK